MQVRRSYRAIAILVLALLAVGYSQPVWAAGETISVGLAQEDGTPDAPDNTWSVDDSAGNDSGPFNGIVRTNDTLKYTVEVRVEDAEATNVTIDIALPQGVEAGPLPPFCIAGSSITPAVLPPPPTPVTATSWMDLATQTISCNVGTRNPGSNLGYPFTAIARPEVPNGTALAPVTASVHSDDVPAVVTNAVDATVSAAPRYDISKNAISFSPNAGYLGGGTRGACPSDPLKMCFNYLASVLISTPNGGKGSSPLAGTITLTDDLSPEALYGEPNGYAVTTDTDWIAAGTDALQKYGAELRSCPRTSVYTAPGFGIGGTLTEANSVRDSGTFTCTQPGGPGTPVTISIENADTSAYTVPSVSYYPNGNALPANVGYVVAGRIDFGIPIDAVTDLGVSSSNGAFDLRWTNSYLDFEPLGLDGTPNDPAFQLAVNDSRALTSSVRARGSWSKAFIGVPGNPGNTPPSQFRPGWQVWEGPTNTTTYRSGDGILLPGQPVISGLAAHNSSTSTDPITFLLCDNWDNSKLQLAPGNYPGGSARMQQIPSNGAAVWWQGYTSGSGYQTSDAGLPALNVEYGTGAFGNTETCEDADSPTGWTSDYNLVPGGIGAISKVRIHTVVPANTITTGTYTTIAIAMEALGTDPFTGQPNPTGTVMPNFASGKTLVGDFTQAEALASGVNWATGTYDPATAVGTRGDRMIMGNAVARLNKEVWDNNASDWVTTVPSYTGNVDVDYRLSSSLTAGFSTDSTLPVMIEDCLPQYQSYVNGSGSIAPTIVQLGAPVDADLACPAGQVYVRWDLGSLPVGQAIPPVTYTAHVSSTTPNGTLTNNALITAEGDPSEVADRTASAQIEIIQPVGVAIDKRALTPQSDINLAGESNPDPLLWEISFRNLDLPGTLSDVDVIDILPRDGFNGSSYSGTLTFDQATVTSGTNVTILYTKAASASLSMDGADATNDPATGTTVWCDLPVGGSVVSGLGTAADCPADGGEVTGLRIQRPGIFAPTDRFDVEVAMIPLGNSETDVYINYTSGRAVGLVQPVGPVGSPEVIVASSLGDRVWLDTNGNGIQDFGENGLDGITVSLWGLDDSGNAVASQVAPLTTVTSGGGLYNFADLPAGTYQLQFDGADLTADQRWTGQATTLATNLDSDGDITNGRITDAVLGVNQDRTDLDQGVVELRKVSGHSFFDSNDDGDRIGEIPLPNVTVTISGFDNVGRPVLFTTTTDDDGFYEFPDLWPGTYTVTQDQSTVPAIYQNGQTVAGSTGGTVTDNQITLNLSSVDSVENNFGEIEPASLSGHVYEDDNEDGAFDQDEEDGIEGVTVTLTGTDYTGNPVSVVATTGPGGVYEFPNLRPGTYTVTETHPDEYFDGQDNAGTHGGTAADDLVSDVVLSAGDTAEDYDFGEIPQRLGLSMQKFVNGVDANDAPGPAVAEGDPVIFTYKITNTSNLVVEDIQLTDDIIGAITCPETVLGAGEEMICMAPDVAVDGQYVNVGSVSGQPLDIFGDPSQPRLEAEDPAHYFGVVTGLTIVKTVNADDANTAPGIFLNLGDPVTFTYTLTNTGNVDLTDVALDDDVLGAITCPATTIAAGESMVCQVSDIAVAGNYVNVGTVTGQPTLDDGTAWGDPLSADDPAHYFGEDLGIVLVKRVNGEDANTAPGLALVPGDEVVFTYEISNTGNLVLDDIVLDDDIIGAVTCPQTTLAVGETMTCSATDTAVEGPYVNVGTVNAQPLAVTGLPSGPRVETTNPAHYIGAVPGLTLVKSVDGADANETPGKQVYAGDTVTFTYELTNTGNIDLANVVLSDDILGAIDCPQFSLAAGESMTCEATSTAIEGPYVNIGAVVAQPVVPDGTSWGPALYAEDPAHYFGERADVQIVKMVNGEDANDRPGVQVEEGDELRFTYTVTNTGNVALSGVAVDDDVLGPVPCPMDTLEPGESMTCELLSRATIGTVTNIGTVTANEVDDRTDPGSVSVRDTDVAIYTAIAIVKGQQNNQILAFTGASTMLLLLLALGFIGVGAVFMFARRRLLHS